MAGYDAYQAFINFFSLGIVTRQTYYPSPTLAVGDDEKLDALPIQYEAPEQLPIYHLQQQLNSGYDGLPGQGAIVNPDESSGEFYLGESLPPM